MGFFYSAAAKPLPPKPEAHLPNQNRKPACKPLRPDSQPADAVVIRIFAALQESHSPRHQRHNWHRLLDYLLALERP
jgi:hypothetical protein